MAVAKNECPQTLSSGQSNCCILKKTVVSWECSKISQIKMKWLMKIWRKLALYFHGNFCYVNDSATSANCVPKFQRLIWLKWLIKLKLQLQRLKWLTFWNTPHISYHIDTVQIKQIGWIYSVKIEFSILERKSELLFFCCYPFFSLIWNPPFSSFVRR